MNWWIVGGVIGLVILVVLVFFIWAIGDNLGWKWPGPQ